MYRFNDRCNMGPRGRMNGHRGFRPEIFLGIIGLMFFGWIILAVIGGLLGAGFMVLGSVVRGLARVAPRLFASRSVAVGLALGLVWYFRTHRRNAEEKKNTENECSGTVDGAAAEAEVIEAPAYRSFGA